MNYGDYFLDLFKITFAVFAGIIIAFRLAWPKIEQLVFQLKLADSKKEIKATNQDKTQFIANAYERFLLYTTRIEPKQLMARHFDENISVNDFHQHLLRDVETEFQHNYTQQLYVSKKSWDEIKLLKESTVSLLNQAYQNHQSNTVNSYTQEVLGFLTTIKINPYLEIQDILKQELNKS